MTRYFQDRPGNFIETITKDFFRLGSDGSTLFTDLSWVKVGRLTDDRRVGE